MSNANSYNQFLMSDKAIIHSKNKMPKLLSPRIPTNQSQGYFPPDNVPVKQSSKIKKQIQIKHQNSAIHHSNKKLLPLVLKDIVNQIYLRELFELIKNRVCIKKIAFQLLLNKRNKNLISAFFKLKLNAFQLKINKFTSRVGQLKEAKFLTLFIGKRIRQNYISAFRDIKGKSQRKMNIFKFIQKLSQNLQMYVKRQFSQMFILKLKSLISLTKVKNKCIYKICVLNSKKTHRLIQLSFNKIVNFSIFITYDLRVEQKIKKDKLIVSLSTSRRTVIKQEKENLKKLKNSFTSMSLEKNRSLNELKKSRTILKQQLNIDLRSLQKQQGELTCQLNETKDFLAQSQRLFNLRNKSKIQAQRQDYVEKVMKLYQNIQNLEKQQIELSQNTVINEFIQGKQQQKFQNQSPQCYFHMNLELLQLVHVFERGKNLSTNQVDSIYLESLRQNQSLKNLSGLLVKRQIQKNIHGSIIKFSRQMKVDWSFSPLKTFQSDFLEKSSQKTTQFSKQQSFLPYSSKSCQKSFNLENPTRAVGEIRSSCTYLNS